MTLLALIAAASLTFLPLGVFVRRLVIEPVPDIHMPPLPAESLDRGAARW